MSEWTATNFQDEGGNLSFHLVAFNDFTLLVLTLIITFVLLVLALIDKSPYIRKVISSHHFLEFIWTLLPVIVLVTVAIPSLTLLFIIEDSSSAFIRTKVIGYQWYWSYQNAAGDIKDEYFSYILDKSAARDDSYRLLDTTEFLPLPVDVPMRVLVSSADVLHSWAVPALGVKVDACPGRLNEIIVRGSRSGTFFGQCSEICGSNHSFIPIEVKVLPWHFWGNEIA